MNGQWASATKPVQFPPKLKASEEEGSVLEGKVGNSGVMEKHLWKWLNDFYTQDYLFFSLMACQ